MAEQGLTDHDRCMIDTLFLEVELYGTAVSPSVEARVWEIDEQQRLRFAAQYGGSLGLMRTTGTPAGPGRLVD